MHTATSEETIAPYFGGHYQTMQMAQEQVDRTLI